VSGLRGLCVAPDESQYVSEHHISHFWFCESCYHQFETSDHLYLEVYPMNRYSLRR
jgi:hypothetical protein